MIVRTFFGQALLLKTSSCIKPLRYVSLCTLDGRIQRGILLWAHWLRRARSVYRRFYSDVVWP